MLRAGFATKGRGGLKVSLQRTSKPGMKQPGSVPIEGVRDTDVAASVGTPRESDSIIIFLGDIQFAAKGESGCVWKPVILSLPEIGCVWKFVECIQFAGCWTQNT